MNLREHAFDKNWITQLAIIISDAFVTSETKTERTVYGKTGPSSEATPVRPRAVPWVIRTEELPYVVDWSIFPNSSDQC